MQSPWPTLCLTSLYLLFVRLGTAAMDSSFVDVDVVHSCGVPPVGGKWKYIVYASWGYPPPSLRALFHLPSCI